MVNLLYMSGPLMIESRVRISVEVARNVVVEMINPQFSHIKVSSLPRSNVSTKNA